jgi:23S rRNA (cytosine1962-C5)-methyltransferase
MGVSAIPRCQRKLTIELPIFSHSATDLDRSLRHGTKPAMTSWLLKKGSEKKFRSGHPWVFSNELLQSPKGVMPGELVELKDYQGGFLALGYGHPNSLISFRTLSKRQVPAVDGTFFRDRLLKASELRRLAGLSRWSHRLCFAEGDYLPGLVIDRFRLEGDRQVFVLQSSTAGMDRLLAQVIEGLELMVKEECARDSEALRWDVSAVIVANDSKSRAMEGIPVEPKRVLRGLDGFDPATASLIAEPSLPGLKPVTFQADLIGGQKTGFFLDQRFNIQLTSRFLSSLAKDKIREGREVRILDLCCYIGQWGAHLANVVNSLGGRAAVTSVDASAKALEIAARNVEAHGGRSTIEKLDVLEGLEKFEARSFDVVICDPPAFIKKKKDLPTGTQAYFKLNRDAIRKTAGGGLYVSCSCSGLFTEEDFRSMLARVVSASGVEARWMARGAHSADHPQRPEFPQGTYLKGWIGSVT